MGTTPVEEVAKDLTEWITENSWQESIFLTPEPRYYVDSTALMDHLVKVTGIPKDKFIKWSNEKADEIRK